MVVLNIMIFKHINNLFRHFLTYLCWCLVLLISRDLISDFQRLGANWGTAYGTENMVLYEIQRACGLCREHFVSRNLIRWKLLSERSVDCSLDLQSSYTSQRHINNTARTQTLGGKPPGGKQSSQDKSWVKDYIMLFYLTKVYSTKIKRV